MSELLDAIQAVKDGQAKITDDVQQVLALLQQPNPDVAAAIEALQGISASQTAADAALDAATGVANP